MKFGIWELLIVLAIVIFIFGTKRLRNSGGDIGEAIKGFKKAVKDEKGTLTEKGDTANAKEERIIEHHAEKEPEKTAEK